MHHKFRNSYVDKPERWERLEDLTGARCLTTMSGIAAVGDWTYSLKPDSSRRRNMVLDLDLIPQRPWFVGLWVVESGNQVLVEILRRRVAFHYALLDSLVVQHTSPQLVLIAAAWRRLEWRRFLSATGFRGDPFDVVLSPPGHLLADLRL